MILQLDPPLPMSCPKGEGLAHLVIDNGVEHNLQWVLFINETGECWTYDNTQVRASKNITMGRFLGEDKVTQPIIKKNTHYPTVETGLCGHDLYPKKYDIGIALSEQSS